MKKISIFVKDEFVRDFEPGICSECPISDFDFDEDYFRCPCWYLNVAKYGCPLIIEDVEVNDK